jgi:hypothetical protein
MSYEEIDSNLAYQKMMSTEIDKLAYSVKYGLEFDMQTNPPAGGFVII